ncbi:hypothetical protein [Christiangramia sp.]|uniref:hypothetical protein n=1 Tax=Christiangramia sp. TaxID=1931228 RepID=UPI00260A5B53|nr:hypothetical protein [Christiangramia sp.]
MNYIKLLNAVYEKFYDDDRLNATHISLYMALFQEWNFSRFASEFFINRNDIMRVSKIASKSSYHGCLVQLNEWGYIHYFPTKNPYKSSKVSMVVFKTTLPNGADYDPRLEQLEDEFNTSIGGVKNKTGTSSDQVEDKHDMSNGQVVGQEETSTEPVPVSPLNSNKQVNNNKLPNGKEAVVKFFKEKGFSADEGKRFFEYYQDQHWKTSNGQKIRDWQAIAISWMGRAFKKPVEEDVGYQDNLKTKKIKRYDQPL